MARRRHTPEQIIRKLREADRMLADGKDIAEVARHLEVSEQTYHRWRNQFGGMKADDAKPDCASWSGRTFGSSASWPTRSLRSMRSERSAETLL
jgi:transposase-like protein